MRGHSSSRSALRPSEREHGHPLILAVSEEARVTPIELFFDLVFVFSLTQVTALMAADLSVRGLVRGLLLLALLWWCWVAYAWLGNVVRADEGLGRVAMFGAMAAMFVMAVTVPEAFDDLARRALGTRRLRRRLPDRAPAPPRDLLVGRRRRR